MKIKKLYKTLLFIGAALTIIFLLWGKHLLCFFNYSPVFDMFSWGKKIEVPLQISGQDNNQNQIPDVMDIVQGARQEVERGTVYDSSYYQQGYPPDGKGACTDVVWRAFQAAGYNLRQMVDDDIRAVPGEYGDTGEKPDSAIDFRRVRNLQVFFQRHAQTLTIRIEPGDIENLAEWQPGDIVVFAPPIDHIGIISDHRRHDGVPLVIHNAGPRASEADVLGNWPTEIVYHFRFIAD